MQDESKKAEHAEYQDGLVYPKSPNLPYSFFRGFNYPNWNESLNPFYN